ncbi:Uncharacterised protein [Vibrio cholerae]|nr:Uncharacterised protein [Vibrio cholerae]
MISLTNSLWVITPNSSATITALAASPRKAPSFRFTPKRSVKAGSRKNDAFVTLATACSVQKRDIAKGRSAETQRSTVSLRVISAF